MQWQDKAKSRRMSCVLSVPVPAFVVVDQTRRPLPILYYRRDLLDSSDIWRRIIDTILYHPKFSCTARMESR